MRNLIMWNIITLDGYFEGNQNWDLTFHNVVWGQELMKADFQSTLCIQLMILKKKQ
jgi:hypothetical protein